MGQDDADDEFNRTMPHVAADQPSDTPSPNRSVDDWVSQMRHDEEQEAIERQAAETERLAAEIEAERIDRKLDRETQQFTQGLQSIKRLPSREELESSWQATLSLMNR